MCTKPLDHNFINTIYNWVSHNYDLTGDTFILVVRKKSDQEKSINLNVWDYSLTCIWLWVVVRYAPGGHSTSLIMTFNNVSMELHLYYIWMDLNNTPYSWASQQYPWFRQHLTTLQLAQVLVSNIQQTYALLMASSCDYPWQITFGFFLFMGYWLLRYFNIYLALYVKPGIDR